MKICKKCISKNTDEAECCFNCGAKFQQEMRSPASSGATWAMRATVKVISVLGIASHLFLMLLAAMASGLSDGGSEPTSNAMMLFYLTPFFYFVFCFVTSFRVFNGRFLLACGIIAHLVIIPYYYYAVRGGVWFIAVIPLFLTVAWFRMCLYKEHQIK